MNLSEYIGRRRLFAWIAWASLILFSFSSHAAQNKPIELQHAAITVNGVERTFYYHIPERLGENYPLVIVLHSAKSNGKVVGENWGFLELSEKAGFGVIFPNGWYGEWNDGRNAPFRYKFLKHNKDDVGFLSLLIRQFEVEYKADPSRIYLTGASNGGIMVLRAACEISQQLTAIAPLLSSLPKNLKGKCSPKKALPVLMMNGTNDKTIPMDGGKMMVDREGYGELIPVYDTLDIWLQSNVCNYNPVYGKRDEFLAARKVKGIDTELYSDCNSGNVVALYLLKDGEHFIPSFKRRKMNTEYDKDESNFIAAKEIWDFFKQYRD